MNMIRLVGVLALSVLMSGCAEKAEETAFLSPAAEATAPAAEELSVPNPPEARNGHATVSGHAPAELAATVIRSNPVKNGAVHHNAARIPDVAGEIVLSEEPESLNEYAVKVQVTEKMTLDMNQSVRAAGQQGS